MRAGWLGSGISATVLANAHPRKSSHQPLPVRPEDGQELLPRPGYPTGRLPQVRPPPLVAATEVLGDELVLAAEAVVERPLGDPRPLRNGIHTNGPYTLPIEKFRGRLQQPLSPRPPPNRTFSPTCPLLHRWSSNLRKNHVCPNFLIIQVCALILHLQLHRSVKLAMTMNGVDSLRR
jgi:hypothetical protein